MGYRILLVDDHLLLLQALRRVLEAELDLSVVAIVVNGLEAIEGARALCPDAIVMDLAMPGLNGIDATRQITSEMPQISVICLSAAGDHRSIVAAFRAGAKAYVLKTSAADELTTAIRNVRAGEVFLSPAIARVVMRDVLLQDQRDSPLDALSIREREVLQLIAEGHSTKGVAAMLHVSVKTAETHRRNLMEKLNIDNIAGLTRFAVREGLTAL